tara:strand:+ start:10194 stop:11651 length:1458 start_codon:yes stop_codon:yes gene_type:complete
MVDNTKRLDFLRDRFNITKLSGSIIKQMQEDYEERDYSCTKVVSYRNDKKVYVGLVFKHEIIELDEGGNQIFKVDDDGNKVIKAKIKIYLSNDVFDNIVDSDPTNNKICSQWMFEIYTSLLKAEESVLAGRFYDEDLPLANEYLKIFEANKRKKKFLEFSKASYLLKNMIDPTNINQYKSLNQLYDAVDPFIIRDPSEMEKTLNKFVEMGHAHIPVRDRQFLVYIPTSVDASIVFNNFVSWCTSNPGNSNFKGYRNDYKKPNRRKSDIYIIINTKFFTDELEDNFLYQIHFETNQVKNRKQSNSNFYEDVLQHSESLSNFFYEELTEMAKDVGNVNKNLYLDYLVRFGWTEAMFDLLDVVTPKINLLNIEVPRLPNLTKFSMLEMLTVIKSNLVKIDDSIGKLSGLELLSIPGNRIRRLPKEIGNLKNLVFLNIKGNPIEEIPEELKYLDKSNGGSLYRLVVSEDDIGKDNYNKLKELLPETILN